MSKPIKVSEALLSYQHAVARRRIVDDEVFSLGNRLRDTEKSQREIREQERRALAVLEQAVEDEQEAKGF